jgi:hypothetical protein
MKPFMNMRALKLLKALTKGSEFYVNDWIN